MIKKQIAWGLATLLVSALGVVGLMGIIGLLSLQLSGCSSDETPASHPQPSGVVPVKGMVTMVDLGADSCIPCKMMAPIIEKVEKTYRMPIMKMTINVGILVFVVIIVRKVGQVLIMISGHM